MAKEICQDCEKIFEGGKTPFFVLNAERNVLKLGKRKVEKKREGKKMSRWILKHIHPYDSYSVRVTQCDDIRVNIHTYCTVWLFKAIAKYIYFNIKYRGCTIIFTHRRYER